MGDCDLSGLDADTACRDADLGVVVALKPAWTGKSRLDLPPLLRHRLARALAADTLAALSRIAGKLVVVSDDPGWTDALHPLGIDADLLAEPDTGGMNPALSAGDDALRAAGWTRVLACVGDLPALRPASLRIITRAAYRSNRPVRRFLADASGRGTTMLLASHTRLDPRFGGESAAAHRASGAAELSDAELGMPVPDARSDVDVLADLDVAIRLGVGTAFDTLISSGVLKSQT